MENKSNSTPDDALGATAIQNNHRSLRDQMTVSRFESSPSTGTIGDGMYIFSHLTSNIIVKRARRLVISNSSNITIYVNYPCTLILKRCRNIKINNNTRIEPEPVTIRLYRSVCDISGFSRINLYSNHSRVHISYAGSLSRNEAQLVYDLLDTNIDISHDTIDTFILSNLIEKRRGILVFDGDKGMFSIGEST